MSSPPSPLTPSPVERHGVGPDDGGRITLEELTRNPYPAYRTLQEQGVVWVEALNRWIVTRWEDVDSIERQGDCFTAVEEGSLQTRVMGRTMLRTDGDEHRRLRKASQAPFMPATVEETWLPIFEAHARDLVEAIKDAGRADLMTQFASPFAARCLGSILGLEGSSHRLQEWSQALMDGTANYADSDQIWERSERAAAEIDEATDIAIERARSEPEPTVIGAMVGSDGNGQPLSRDEILANVKLVIGGGLNEPRDALGFTLWGLLTHREQLAMVQRDPSLWPAAIEEAVRWMSPLAMFPRQVKHQVKIGQTELFPGARLALVVAAANRDPRKWDRPDQFDIRRPKARNLAFGAGPHFCLGVWMARHSLSRAALPIVFSQLREIDLDFDLPPEIRGWVFRGHTRLHVTWKTN